MSLILVKEANHVMITTEDDLMDDLMMNYTGEGIPDTDWADKHPVGEVLNGTLTYEPEVCGNYLFRYHSNAGETAYKKMLHASDDKVAVAKLIDTYAKQKVLRKEEVEALQQLFL